MGGMGFFICRNLSVYVALPAPLPLQSFPADFRAEFTTVVHFMCNSSCQSSWGGNRYKTDGTCFLPREMWAEPSQEPKDGLLLGSLNYHSKE